MARIVIVAALEREIRPLTKHWHCEKLFHEGHELSFCEGGYASIAFGGIGPEAARRAAEAAIARYSPDLVISAGIAGALTPELRVGETIFPSLVINAQDGSRHETAIKLAMIGKTPLARTTLVSFAEIAGVEQKQKLGKAFAAQAVDMEAAAVAVAAQQHGLKFLAIKAISDEVEFEMPEIQRFVRDGEFLTQRFVLHVSLRPWLWLKVARLARNTKLASENLCAWLRESALTNTIVPGGKDVEARSFSESE